MVPDRPGKRSADDAGSDRRVAGEQPSSRPLERPGDQQARSGDPAGRVVARGLLLARRRCPVAGRGRPSWPRRRGSGPWCGSTPARASRRPRAEIDAAVLRLVRGLVPVPEVLEVRPARPRRRPARAARHVVPVRASAATSCCRRSTTPGWPRSARRSVTSLPTSAGCRCRAAVRSSTPTWRSAALGARRAAGVRRDPAARARPPDPRGDRRAPRGRGRRPGAARHGDPGLPGAQRPQPQEPAARPGHAGADRGARLGVRARRAPVHRPRQPAALRPCSRRSSRRAGAPTSERRGTSPEQALALARAADLYALVDLAARRAANPVAERADRLLRAIARERDPGVHPR